MGLSGSTRVDQVWACSLGGGHLRWSRIGVGGSARLCREVAAGERLLLWGRGGPGFGLGLYWSGAGRRHCRAGQRPDDRLWQALDGLELQDAATGTTGVPLPSE